MSGPVGVGLIGAGNISDQYLSNLVTFPDLQVLAIGDLDVSRAKAQAEKYNVPAGGDADLVLQHPDIQIVINLTIPAAHEEVSVAALRAGKHVWTEKPLSVDRASGRRILDEAERAGRRVGSAPDTVLGSGFQTAKRAIEDGLIGEPLSATTSMSWQGPDWAHPNPAFLFARGGGPLFDMGPYYVSGLVHLFGTLRTVAAIGTRASETRSVHLGPRAGETFPVEVPTNVTFLSEFAAGQTAQSTLSNDAARYRHGVFEVNGTEGTLVLPDPNMFSGELHLYRPIEDFSSWPIHQEPITVPEVGHQTGRGLGVLEMARAIQAGRPHIASGELAYHVLDILVSVEEAASQHTFLNIDSSVEVPAAMPDDFDPFAATL